ncbi:MAG: GHKL domain-containing protein [Lachnospiraceae bacterium]|nr:GHKL domain-containing protein [Lachnospiraceae bacterium]
MQIIFLFLDNLLFLVFISAGIMFSDKEKRHTGTNAVLLSTNLFCIGIILFVIRTAAERQEALSTTAMISIVLSLILSGIFLVLFYLIREEDAEARKMAVIHNHLETQEKQNAETDSLFRSFQMLKHNMNHYVKSISSYVNNNDMAGVQHELNRLSKETETANALISGCSEVDAAVYLKTLEFKKEGIPFTCHLCDLSKIPITPFELNSIIINLLDNAKRAVSDPEVSDPYVDFRINRMEQMLIVQCSNTLSEKQLEHLNGPDPLKKAITENGLGLKVIRHIADRYDAVFTVNLVRDCFHAVVSFEYPD